MEVTEDIWSFGTQKKCSQAGSEYLSLIAAQNVIA
jgi:hypothetical protein